MKINFVFILMIAQYFTVLGQACSPDSLIVRSIRAFATDSSIDWELQSHQVFINPDCIPNNKLVLHLVGSIDNPANTTFFPALAANHGFKVINLKYPNDVTATGACANSADVDCFRKYRQEIIFGVDTSSELTVDSNNCVMNRFLKLLVHLDNLYPSENWNSFLSGSDDLKWSNIILSGHSQGGGHAAFIAKQFELDRVLMFASPNDYSTSFSAPAPWVSSISATPDSNYYAFGNLFDEVVDFSKQYQVWEAMNLLDQEDSIYVDISSCFYNNSRVLYTKRGSITSGVGYHSAMIIDNFTPISSGMPVFIPVWKYMLGICEPTTSILETDNPNSKIELFPNPSRNRLFVKSENVISKLEIYNPSGKLLAILQPNSNKFEVDVEPYKGVLFLRLSTAGYQHKMMKVVSLQ